eukprot:CAMPEP_0179093660 /NCGR_PEP_ID=MMETSP0796-20121207/42907_1 /TAXON_ID=73915 /ORGANISM="Pyrodinium bahamense, Strain pbaha01" /LENGTH=279 /DNA_ID=CAMNT_0020791303 /DNA_START=1 /DNA_END=841 /DNA_ORIENTATION=-
MEQFTEAEVSAVSEEPASAAGACELGSTQEALPAQVAKADLSVVSNKPASAEGGGEERSVREDVPSAPGDDSATTVLSVAFEVTVATLLGDARTISRLAPTYPLSFLLTRVAVEFRLLRSAVRLVWGTRAFSVDESDASLESLGIGPGAALLLVRIRAAKVEAGLRVVVSGAGTGEVNGTYVASLDDRRSCTYNGAIDFHKENHSTKHCISWFAAESQWPSGWYIEKTFDREGIYFLKSRDSAELPLDMWEVYDAPTWAEPGELPTPSIDVASPSSDAE